MPESMQLSTVCFPVAAAPKAEVGGYRGISFGLEDHHAMMSILSVRYEEKKTERG